MPYEREKLSKRPSSQDTHGRTFFDMPKIRANKKRHLVEEEDDDKGPVVVQRDDEDGENGMFNVEHDGIEFDSEEADDGEGDGGEIEDDEEDEEDGDCFVFSPFLFFHVPSVSYAFFLFAIAANDFR